MAHYAQLDDDNTVLDVMKISDDYEDCGEDYINNVCMIPGRWIKTSYNGTIRGSFAGVGFSYNEELDVFLPPKPYESWVINTELKCWESPVERPEISNTEAAIWDETNQQWIIVQRPITMINLDL
jgi:hypothetical protein